MPLLNAAVIAAPDQVVVRFTGDADLSTLPLVTEALDEAAGLGTRQIVVDLAATRFWDCSGLHALCTLTSALTAAGRGCRIVGAPPATRRLIGAAALADHLDLDGPVQAAGPTAQARASRRAMSSAERVSVAAPRFSVRCSTDFVPGIGSTTGDFWSSHASAT